MHTLEINILSRNCRLYAVHSLTRFKSKAELAVNLTRHNKRMSVRVNTGLDTKEHACGFTALACYSAKVFITGARNGANPIAARAAKLTLACVASIASASCI